MMLVPHSCMLFKRAIGAEPDRVSCAADGIMSVYATPSLVVASICSSLFFGVWNLFAGQPEPKLTRDDLT